MIIRSARPRDRDAVHRICVATADAGEPAGRFLLDQDLVSYVYADPYLLLQPELAFVAEANGVVLGYVVAALDSEEFYARWQLEWSPRFATSHPADAAVNPADADSQLRAFLHHPRLLLFDDLQRYPAHLHINLLSAARRQGVGRGLIGTVFQELARAGAPGVQLGVRVDNTRAHAFYRAMGMIRLPSRPQEAVRFGRPLRG